MAPIPPRVGWKTCLEASTINTPPASQGARRPHHSQKFEERNQKRDIEGGAKSAVIARSGVCFT